MDDREDLAASKSFWSHEDIPFSCVWSNDLAVIKYENEYYLVPQPYLIMIHNKVCDIFSVLVYSECVDGATYEEGCADLTVKFILEWCQMAIKLKDKFFHVAKALEAIVTAMTLQEIDGWNNREFLEAVLEDLNQEIGVDLSSTQLYYLLEEASPSFRHELGCLSKIMGHPMVDMKAGAEKLHRNTTEDKEIDLDVVRDCVRQAKKSFIKQYILRHGKWPSVVCHARLQRVVEMAMLHNKDPDSKAYTNRYGTDDLTSYDNIEILPCMQFDYLENFIPYLKDKTLSVLRSPVFQKYIARDKEGQIKWADTRLLLHYLLNDKSVTDHIKYTKRYEDSVDLHELIEYLVCRIVPKEKELKSVFRGFGCQTYFERARRLVQEENVMQYLDLYSNEQAMTLGELEITRKLMALRRIKTAYPGYTPLYIVIDSSSWNNRFRDVTVAPVMEETLDKIFDTTIFGKTQLAYENTLFYVPDTEGTYWWDGQGGGIEGLNQDTWVVTYISQIKAALKDFHTPMHILCKGDDMRVVLLIPPTLLEVETIPQIKNRLVTQISTTLDKLGHKINIQESYGSASYFAFSKSASADTIEFGQSFRKIQRCYGANNAFLPTLDEYIGTSFSNAHSACRVSPTFFGPYIVALTWSYYHLLHHEEYAKLSHDNLVGVLLVPSLLGGFPIIYLHNMMVRAESDLLSPFIGLYLYCYDNFHHIKEVFDKFWSATMIEPDIAFKGLLQDSYSLPIKKPSMASSVLRSLIAPALKDLIKNQDIKILFKLKEENLNEAIEECLMNSNVYNARIFAAIYAASPEGLLQSLVRKFESGRSILEILILRWKKPKALQMLRTVIKADEAVHKHRLRKLRSLIANEEVIWAYDGRTSCPNLIAQQVRERWWGTRVESVTMPPLQHQIHIVDPFSEGDNSWPDTHHFSYIRHIPTKFVDPQRLLGFSTADKEPFLGYSTRRNMEEAQVRFVEKNLILSKVKQLLEIGSWTNLNDVINGELVSSNFHVLVR